MGSLWRALTARGGRSLEPADVESLYPMVSTALGRKVSPVEPLEIRPYGAVNPLRFRRSAPHVSLLPGHVSFALGALQPHYKYTQCQVRVGVKDWVFSVESSAQLGRKDFLKTTVYPGDTVWGNGRIPPHLLLHPHYPLYVLPPS